MAAPLAARGADPVYSGGMSTLASQRPTGAPAHRQRLRFTPQDYWFLVEQGMVPERSELVDGEIYEMPPQYHPAVAAIGRIDLALKTTWRSPDLVAVNGSHVFPGGWQPLPDVAVYDALPPRRPGPGVAWPTPRLIVEVADETLAYDLGEKSRRYAAEAVEELWVGDVAGRLLHVLREPIDGDWRVRRVLRVGESVSPLCLPSESFAVADLLPDLYGAG